MIGFVIFVAGGSLALYGAGTAVRRRYLAKDRRR